MNIKTQTLKVRWNHYNVLFVYNVHRWRLRVNSWPAEYEMDDHDNRWFSSSCASCCCCCCCRCHRHKNAAKKTQAPSR